MGLIFRRGKFSLWRQYRGKCENYPNVKISTFTVYWICVTPCVLITDNFRVLNLKIEKFLTQEWEYGIFLLEKSDVERLSSFKIQKHNICIMWEFNLDLRMTLATKIEYRFLLSKWHTPDKINMINTYSLPLRLWNFSMISRHLHVSVSSLHPLHVVFSSSSSSAMISDRLEEKQKEYIYMIRTRNCRRQSRDNHHYKSLVKHDYNGVKQKISVCSLKWYERQVTRFCTIREEIIQAYRYNHTWSLT